MNLGIFFYGVLCAVYFLNSGLFAGGEESLISVKEATLLSVLLEKMCIFVS